MIFVFDLDDTLYPEASYVQSGFMAVAEFLAGKYNLSTADCTTYMNEVLQKQGRGLVFDFLLKKYNLYSKKNVTQCLHTYRLHTPNIKLFDDAKYFLNLLADKPKYIVTDGNKIVQHKKVDALHLYPLFKKVFITHRYGIEKEKPNPYCFLKICKLEKTHPQNVIYIGDNPNKDFIGIKQLGFKTIRVKKGMFEHLVLDKAHEADLCVTSLVEINLKTL